MYHTKKMILVPDQDGAGDQNLFETSLPVVALPESPAAQVNVPQKRKNLPRRSTRDRQRNMFLIAVKLALNGLVNARGEFKSNNGEMVDVRPLVLRASKNNRSERGMGEFINMLHKAGVKPDLVINTSVKEKLQQLLNSEPKRKQRESSSFVVATPSHAKKGNRANTLSAPTHSNKSLKRQTAKKTAVNGQEPWDSIDSEDET